MKKIKIYSNQYNILVKNAKGKLKMNRKAIATILIMALTISTLMLNGCQKETAEPEITDSEPIIEEITEEELISSSEPEISDEAIEPILPETKPFMEQSGILFDIVPEVSFNLHTSVSKNEEIPEEQDFEAVLTEVKSFKASENHPEVDGYNYKQGTFIIYKNESGKGVTFSAYVCDYYTGEIIQFDGGKDVSPEMTKAMADKAFIVKVGETEYSISAFSDFQVTDYGWKLTFTALVPDEYDGLCFAIGGEEAKETNETEDESAETEEKRLFIMDTSYGEKSELWHFYRAQIELDTQEKTDFSKELETEKMDGANAGSGNIEVPDDIVEGTGLTQEEIDELLGQ